MVPEPSECSCNKRSLARRSLPGWFCGILGVRLVDPLFPELATLCLFCYLSITPPTVCPSGSLTKKDAVLFFRHPYVFAFLGCCFLSLILVIDLVFLFVCLFCILFL